MDKLISMTDFVLEQVSERNKEPEYDSFEFMEKVSKYANFLKQPLQLGFFVPCDLDGNVLEEPKEKQCEWCLESHNLNCEDCKKELRQYQEAKERVLFEGFRLDGRYMWHETNLFMISDNIQDSFKGRNTEFLLSCYKGAEIVLTESAKNQIFGV